MSSSKQGFRNLDYCVHSVMADLEEVSMVNYQRYLKWAIDCFNDLTLYRFPMIKSVELTVKSNYTVDWPEDYVDYVAVGVNINGRLWTLTLNEKMTRKPLEDCVVTIEQAAQDESLGITPYGYIFGGSYRNGQYVGEQYAYGGGWNYKGYYRVDHANRRFELSSVRIGSKIILEYVSNGIDCDGSAEVPFAAVPVITSYIHWMRYERDKKAERADKARAHNLYMIEYNKYTHLSLMFTMDEYLDNKYAQVRMTPKR